MNDRGDLRIILDTSAVVAYARGGVDAVDVCELILVVEEEKGTVGVPVLCMTEAARIVADTKPLQALSSHPAVEIVPVDGADWRPLAAILGIIGRHDAAGAALLAIGRDSYVVTSQPGLYGGLPGGGPVITF